MIIKKIEKHSIAADLGLMPGDDLRSINSHAIRDEIDFQFWSAEDQLSFQVARGDAILSFELAHGLEGWFGAEFDSMQYRCCGNKCVFCFVDQNPQGLRPTLYFKDEDYRLSFLYGNYVTLTNTSNKDLQRIVAQRLSPLFVSVHATNPAVRRKLLGIRGNDRLMEKIAFLADHSIQMHAQIVLCPGWNDGAELDRTVADLAGFYPTMQSIAIVPVGLTRHRQNLTRLEPLRAEQAGEMIRWHKLKSGHFKQVLGSYFVFLADEFYLLAEEELPKADRYEDFAQIENGVGMSRQLIDQIRREKRSFPKDLPGMTLSIVTGEMAAPVLQRHLLPALQKIDGLQVNLHAVQNRFYGGHVSVSGLLVGQDIAEQLRHVPLGNLLVLPPNCLNTDDVFLDDWTCAKLEQSLSVKVYKPDQSIREILRKLA